LEFIIWVVLPVLIIGYCIKSDLVSFRELGFHSRVSEIYSPNTDAILFILLLFITPLLLYECYVYFYHLSESLFPVNYGATDFNYGSTLSLNGKKSLSVILYYALTAGLVEEVYYRAMFFRLVEDVRHNFIVYVVVSSLIFSSVHWEGGVRNLFTAFIYGMCCSVIYYKTRNLWPLFLGHFLTDYLIYI